MQNSKGGHIYFIEAMGGCVVPYASKEENHKCKEDHVHGVWRFDDSSQLAKRVFSFLLKHVGNAELPVIQL